MQSGISIFFETLVEGFSWKADGCLFNYVGLLFVVLSIFTKFRGMDMKSDKYLKVAFIAGFWGALYGFALVGSAIGNPHLPQDRIFPFVITASAAHLQTLLIALVGWFCVTSIDAFRPSLAQK